MKLLQVPEKSPHRLLVEGKDDLHTIVHLLRRHGLNYDEPAPSLPYIHSTDGYSELLKALPVAAKSYKRLGVVVDADLDPASRWTEIVNSLKGVGVKVADEPVREGEIASGLIADWRIGVWVMPDNTSGGGLETFLGRLVPANDRCWPHADASTREAKRLDAKFPDKYFEKARIHSWLAWQEEPGQPYGTAITSACFRTDTAEAKAFVSWFQRLFLA